MLNNFFTERRINIDISTLCNLSCAGCARTKAPHSYYPSIMSMDIFKKVASNENNLETIVFSGQYSDPIYSTNLFDCIDHVNTLNNIPNMIFNTNGSGRKQEWWEEFMKRLDNGQKHGIVFAVDGLENTNHIYRVGAKWNSIIEGIKVVRKSFDNTGSTLVWAYCVFEHNHHQVIEAYKLSKSLGVDKFILKLGVSVDHTTLGLKSKKFEDVSKQLQEYINDN